MYQALSLCGILSTAEGRDGLQSAVGYGTFGLKIQEGFNVSYFFIAVKRHHDQFVKESL